MCTKFVCVLPGQVKFLMACVQDPFPVLRLLLSFDAAATVHMFDELPLLQEGVYCGSDDIEAAVRCCSVTCS